MKYLKFDDIRETLMDFMNTFQRDDKDPSHGIDHIERVFNNCVEILKSNSELRVDNVSYLINQIAINNTLLAAAFHDIARSQHDHEIVGAELFYDYCMMHDELLGLDTRTDLNRSIVSDAIRSHRYSKGLVPNSIVGMILQDADRLDAIGAIGIERCLSYSIKKGIPFYDKNIKPKDKYDGSSSTTINHMIEKLLKINPKSFNTNCAKNMARSKHKLMESFVNDIIG